MYHGLEPDRVFASTAKWGNGVVVERSSVVVMVVAICCTCYVGGACHSSKESSSDSTKRGKIDLVCNLKLALISKGRSILKK